MYIYIIDTTIINKKTNIFSQIKNLSKHYSIEGSFIYISALHDLKKEILLNIKEKSNTIIVVGNYDSLNRVVDIIFQLNKINDTVFGLVPLNMDFMSRVLGMTGSIEKDMLCVSQRLYKRLDICSINNKYFLDFINFSFAYGLNIEIDASYIINLENGCELKVSNMSFENYTKQLSNPFDGFFDIVLYSNKNGKRSVLGKFKAKKLNINSKSNVKYCLNNIQYKANNIQVDIINKNIKLILNKSSVLNDM